MKKLLPFIIFIALLNACSNEINRSFGEFNPSKIEAQVFKIRPNEDTTITTKSGVRIKISANTFLNPPSKEIELSVKEVISRADLLRSGIPTVDEHGELLESGGMLNVLTEPRLDINPAAPIVADIPVVGANLDMKKYRADLNNGDMLWKDPEPLTGNPEFENLIKGRELFKSNCASCHAESLDEKLTGPALGCIELGKNKRERDWLVRFTKNSQKMIAEGDRLARCNWLAWRPTVMSSFDSLSDLQINQIYDYINNESLRLNSCGNEEDFGRITSDCEMTGDSSTNTIDNKIEASMEEAMQPALDTLDKNSSNTITSETTIEQTIVFTRTYYYTLPITGYKWINVDCNPFKSDRIEAFDVIADKDLELYMMFKNRKSLWPFCTWKGKYVLMETEIINDLRLPIGEPVTILAFGKPQNGTRAFCEYPTKIQMKNNIKLTTKKITEQEFQKKIASY